MSLGDFPDKVVDGFWAALGSGVLAVFVMILRNARTSAVIGAKLEGVKATFSARLDEREKAQKAEMRALHDRIGRMEAKQDQMFDLLVERQKD